MASLKSLFSLFFLFCLLSLSGCQNEGDSAVEGTPGKTPQNQAAPPSTPNSFSKELRMGNSRLLLQSREKGGDQHELTITGSIEGKKLLEPINRTIYPVVGAEMADLNNDGQPEAYIYLKVNGPNAFGKLLAYTFNSSGFWSQIQVNELPEDMLRGYQGQDSFEVEEGRLLRRFPLYLPNDEPNQPKGGERTIVYELVFGQKKLVLDPTRTI